MGYTVKNKFRIFQMMTSTQSKAEFCRVLRLNDSVLHLIGQAATNYVAVIYCITWCRFCVLHGFVLANERIHGQVIFTSEYISNIRDQPRPLKIIFSWLHHDEFVFDERLICELFDVLVRNTNWQSIIFFSTRFPRLKFSASIWYEEEFFDTN